MQMTGADIVVETLIEQGVDTVFGYPGGTVLDLYDALYKAKDRINHVLSSHEQHACHAADGYARSTGKTGVVIATSGPGSTNLVTGIATAHLDSIPLVAITGNVSTPMIGRDSFQEVDITGVTIPITKHNFIVHKVEDLADTIREAFRIANSGRPGPVLVDIPKDIQGASCDFLRNGSVEAVPSSKIAEQDIQEALKMIRASKKPYIYIGGGAIRADIANEVIDLAERMDAPIGTTLMGISLIPTDHPRYLGMEGMHGHYASSRAQNEADLIFTIGARFSDRATGNVKKYARNAKIIHLDVDAAELNKNVNVDLGMAGDVKDALHRILDELEKQEHTSWGETIASLRDKERELFEKSNDKNRITPYNVMIEVSCYAEEKTPVVTDVGQHQMWAAQYFPFHQPRTFITSGGLGTMGFGLGAAVGAYFGTGQRPILITGDGSFGMNLNDLATVHAYNVPVAIIVLNNKVLGMVRQWQTLFYNRNYSNTNLDMRDTDFVKIAEAFGIPGFHIDSLDEMEETLARAMAKSGPVLIEIAIDRDEFVLPMLPPGGSMDMIITEKEQA